VIMPRPNVTVKSALTLAPERRERVAALQAHLQGQPGDLDARLELADLLLDAHRPDWALATVNVALDDHRDDFRVHMRRAVAYADRFEGAPAFQAADLALTLCEGPTPPHAPNCDDAPRSRLHLLHDTLARVKGIDMRGNPALAKDKIFEGLHPTWLKKPRAPKPVAKPN